jgi:hypothetical protein
LKFGSKSLTSCPSSSLAPDQLLTGLLLLPSCEHQSITLFAMPDATTKRRQREMLAAVNSFLLSVVAFE